MAISDLGVGLLGQLLNIAYLVVLLRCNVSNHNILNPWGVVLDIAFLSSFFSIMALSTERFIAIQKPLRYQDIVTENRIVTVAIIIWLLSSFLGKSFVLLDLNIALASFVIIESLCFVATTWSSFKIYLTLRHHNIQIQSQVRQVSQNSDTARITSLRKSAQTTLLIYLVFWVCYLPRYFILIVHQIQANKSMAFSIMNEFSRTLVLLNSSINLVIYCWTNRHIRYTIMSILRPIFQGNNST